MPDILDALARNAWEEVRGGYYRVCEVSSVRPIGLREHVLRHRGRAIITEIKGASPSAGVIRSDFAHEAIAGAMVRGGAVAISVLTAKERFGGSLKAFRKVREALRVPLLMKDFIVSPQQVEAASRLGADAVLLIQALFDRGHCEAGVEEMIALTHSKGLEVLLEAHTDEEYLSSMKTDADLIGINNRDLTTFRVDIGTTRRILGHCGSNGRLVVSESGIDRPEDVRDLRSAGVDAFLIGSSIMRAEDVEGKVREFAMS